jgi:hypothetical protein
MVALGYCLASSRMLCSDGKCDIDSQVKRALFTGSLPEHGVGAVQELAPRVEPEEVGLCLFYQCVCACFPITHLFCYRLFVLYARLVCLWSRLLNLHLAHLLLLRRTKTQTCWFFIPLGAHLLIFVS